MAGSHPIYLEAGKTWVFACSLDWPGWCRRGRGDEAAVEALLAYAPRYRAAVGDTFVPGDVEVVGRVPGDATTDFGAPSTVGPWDSATLRGKEAERQIAVLEASWRTFDEIAVAAPALLRKGPRGGGRDTAAIVDHTREAERHYAPKIGVRVPPRTPWPDQREAVVTAVRAPGESKWPVRYFLRRVAWHVLDHAWEIEDKSEP